MPFRFLARCAVDGEAYEETRGDLSIGGVHDVRPLAENAVRGARLLVTDLLAIRNTLIASRDLRRSLIKLEAQYPRLASAAQRLYESTGIVNEIGRCLDENTGEVRDDATPELADARRSLREVLSRVQEKLRRIVGNSRNALYLQEAIITQRGGRYVIPIKADFKGRIQGIVHDQSASGATLFIEPLSTVELNNQLRELQLKEQHEVERVLMMLSALVAADDDHFAALLRIEQRRDDAAVLPVLEHIGVGGTRENDVLVVADDLLRLAGLPEERHIDLVLPVAEPGAGDGPRARGRPGSW